MMFVYVGVNNMSLNYFRFAPSVVKGIIIRKFYSVSKYFKGLLIQPKH